MFSSVFCCVLTLYKSLTDLCNVFIGSIFRFCAVQGYWEWGGVLGVQRYTPGIFFNWVFNIQIFLASESHN